MFAIAIGYALTTVVKFPPHAIPPNMYAAWLAEREGADCAFIATFDEHGDLLNVWDSPGSEDMEIHTGSNGKGLLLYKYGP